MSLRACSFRCYRLLSPVMAILLVWGACGFTGSFAPADERRPVGFSNSDIVLTGGLLVTSPESEPVAGSLLIRDGRIAAVGDFDLPADAQVIDITGHFVYAGFIDAATSQGIDAEQVPRPVVGREVDFGRHILAATRPDNRKGITPEFRAGDAFKLGKDQIKARREQGFTDLHLVPEGRLMSGSASLVSLSDGPLREQVLAPMTVSAWHLQALGGDGYPSTLMGAMAHLRQTLLDAARHERQTQLFQTGQAERPAIDKAFTSIQEFRARKTPILFQARSRDDVQRSLLLADEFKLNAALWTDVAHEPSVLSEIKSRQLPLIVRIDFGDEPKVEVSKKSEKLTVKTTTPLRVQQDQRRKWEERVAGLSMLDKAGIQFAISGAGIDKPADIIRNARRAVKAGLPPSAGLAALTTVPAAMLGHDNQLGTLRVGKLAHVVVMTGPWEHTQSKVRFTFIDRDRFEFNTEAKLVDLTTPESQAAQLAGTWTVKIESADKTTGTLQIEQDGTTLTGSFTSANGDGRIRSGKRTGSKLEFVVEIGAGAARIELKFAGELTAENRLEGEMKSAFGAPASWQAERQESSGDTVAEAPKDKTSTAAQESPGESLPTELESDRLQRSIRTGGNVLIQNATVLTVSGPTLENTSIRVRDGIIQEIGPDLQAPEGTTVIDATGLFVMPGIIDTHSHIMITRGINESTLSLVPEVRVRDVVNSEDTSEFRALAGGTTTARLLHGSANVVGGQDAVVKLRYGLTASEHLMKDSHIGVKFALGENVKFRTSRFPNTRMGVEATLNRAFLEAIDYRRQWMEYNREYKAATPAARSQMLAPRRDLRLEALADIVEHRKFIHSHCYRADEILMLLRVASNLGIRVWSLQHVLEGYKIAPEIVAHGASCSTFSDWWAYKVEAYDATPYNAALLQEAGANVVIKSDDAELIRHMNVEAAKTVRYGGLSAEQALRTITLNSARELGLDDRIGSIEVGKEADFAVFNGHPLSSFSRCELSIIDGEVYYQRSAAPSAMTEASRERSQRAPAFSIPTHPARRRGLKLPHSSSGQHAIVGATLHPVDQPPIAAGIIVVKDGQITALGTDIDIPAEAQVIKAKGLHVYPGLIDSGSTLGLTEIGRVRETNDYSESGEIQPDLRAGVAINPDSELFPVARAGGITLSLVRPQGGLIAGQASLIQLAGWTAPEMVADLEAVLVINWPRSPESEDLKELKKFVELAREYQRQKQAAAEAQRTGPIADPRLDSMAPYLAGDRPVLIEAETRQQIAEALLFAEEQKLKIIIGGGSDAWKLAAELKSRDIPVIIGPVMRRPVETYDPQDATYANAARLHEAGVRFCIRSDSASNSRNTPFEAAMAVAYGLPEDAALRALTLSAAEILGIDKQLGSLTTGKRANLVILDGSPLQQTSMVHGIMIGGQLYEPTSRHTRFYQRYRQRLHTPAKPKQEE